MTPTRRLGISNHPYCSPLIRGLETDRSFEIEIDVTAQNAKKLRERKLHAAFLSPIDYARDASEYRVIPEAGIASRQGDTSIALHFRSGIHDVATLAVDPSSASEIVLAKIILAEEFDIEPVLAPVSGSLDAMLQKADAALLSGVRDLAVGSGQRVMLDLVEAWTELTGLPYVHGVWVGRDRDLDAEHIEVIQKLHRDIDAIPATSPPSPAAYQLQEEDEEGFREFLRYAFYHGVLPDVPELHYFGMDTPDEETDLPSLN